MKAKKKLFLLIVIIFLGAMLYLSYDISRKTTFPGSKPQLQERLLKEKSQETDTINDSINHR